MFSIIVAGEPKLRRLLLEEFSYFPPLTRYRPLRLLIDIEPQTICMMLHLSRKYNLLISKELHDAFQYYIERESIKEGKDEKSKTEEEAGNSD